MHEPSWGTKSCLLMVQVTESVPRVQVMLPLGAVKPSISVAPSGAGALIVLEGLAEALGVVEALGDFEGCWVCSAVVCSAAAELLAPAGRSSSP